MTDFSVPRRMSISAFVVILLNTLKRYVNAFVILILLNVFNLFREQIYFSDLFQALLRLLAIVLPVVAIVVVIAFLGYITKKFYIKDANLIFMHGVLRRETTTIPLDRIHAMRTKRGIFYRLFQLRGITFDTLASKTEEMELILDETDWQQLLRMIEKGENPSRASAEQPSYNPENTTGFRFSNINLLKGAICQNHLNGLVILSGLLATVYGRINDVSDTAANEIIVYATDKSESLLNYFWGIPAALLIVYLIVLLLWIGNVVLRYYDMTLSVSTTLLSFEHGLFSRFSSRFSHSKVCTIWVKRNVAERFMNCCTIMLKQALNATAKKENEKLKIYGSNSSELFLRWWLGDNYSHQRELIFAKSGRGVFFHTILPDMALSGFAVAIICHLNLLGWLILPGIYILVSVFKGICAMRRSRISLRESYLVVNNGRFADIENYVQYDDIEVARIKRTPFTRISHRVILEFSTSGSILSVRSLTEKEASLIFELLLQKQTEEPPNDNNLKPEI